jgi:hypothetical protein
LLGKNCLADILNLKIHHLTAATLLYQNVGEIGIIALLLAMSFFVFSAVNEKAKVKNRKATLLSEEKNYPDLFLQLEISSLWDKQLLFRASLHNKKAPHHIIRGGA